MGIPVLSSSPSRVPGARLGNTGRNSHQLDESWREGVTSTASDILQPSSLVPVMTRSHDAWVLTNLGCDGGRTIHVPCTRQSFADREAVCRRTAPWLGAVEHAAERQKLEGHNTANTCATTLAFVFSE